MTFHILKFSNADQAIFCIHSFKLDQDALYRRDKRSQEEGLGTQRRKIVDGFTKKYKTKKLVYFEMTDDVLSAIEREKQIKRWRREKKIALIESMNPQWRDLSTEI